MSIFEIKEETERENTKAAVMQENASVSMKKIIIGVAAGYALGRLLFNSYKSARESIGQRANLNWERLSLVVMSILAIIFLASNSQKSKEILRLNRHLRNMGDTEESGSSNSDHGFRQTTEEEQERYDIIEEELDDGEIDYRLKIGESRELSDGTIVKRTEDGLEFWHS